MMQLVDKLEQPTRSTMPGEWTLLQVQTALKRKISESMLSTKPQGGKGVSYVPRYVINQILDKYAPDRTWEIKQAFVGGDRFYNHRCHSTNHHLQTPRGTRGVCPPPSTFHPDSYPADKERGFPATKLTF